MKKYPVQVIKNGIDINVFRPTHANCLKTNGLSNTKFIIAIASVWLYAKGLSDYINIRKELTDDIKIVLVGLSEQQIAQFPKGMIGISRTQNQLELAQLYSSVEALVCLSCSENFGQTIAEALSCGTPTIVYNNLAQPELVSENTGRIVANGDYKQVALSISEFVINDFKSLHYDHCRNRAIEYFDKNKTYVSYIQLYGKIKKGGDCPLRCCLPVE